MTKRILPLIMLFSSIISFGQTSNFPDGVYLNLEQFKTRTPAYVADLEISKRTSGDIFMMGGNDYKIKSTIDSIDKKYITQKIFAYVKNDSIYLNCVPHKLQTWYALCNGAKGNYITFSACMSLDKARSIALYSGGLGAGMAAKKRYLYVLNLSIGEVTVLTDKTMLVLLKDKPEILSKYENENDRNSEQVMLEYIKQLNQK